VKLGQLMSAVYHYEGSVPFKVGLYNYGSQPITPEYVFVSTSSGLCKGSCECVWTLSPTSPIVPDQPTQLDITSCSSNGIPVIMSTIGTYQLLVYSNANLGYKFTL
jgi:hypothetical protein